MAEADKVALVTGVGKETGLGFAVAQALIDEGFTVLVSARQPEAAEVLARTLDPKSEGCARALALDISDASQIRTAVKTISNDFGKLDVLINNAAAMSPYGELAATADLQAARQVFDTTLYGTWELTQALLPLLRKSQAARVVNVSSGAGSHGDTVFGLTTDNQMGTSYAVSKAALNALTVKFAREESADSIKINAVCPGFTATFDGAENMGARPPAESAKGVVWAAMLPTDGPTGGFFRDGEVLAW